MITAKNILNTCEEWVSLPKVRGSIVNIYENPGSSDYKELNKNITRGVVRFIADAKSKKVFVWDAYLAIHVEVANKLNSEGKISGSTYRNSLLLGEANLSGGGAKMTDSDVFGHVNDLMKIVKAKKPLGYLKEYFDKYEEIFKTDWSFVSRYVNCQYLTDMKNKFNEIKSLYLGN